MLIGYMRVSKSDGSQVFDLQRDAMQVAGVDPAHVYQDQASGRHDDRPGLVSPLRARLGSQKRPKGIDRPRRRYRLVFGIFAAFAEFEREIDIGADARGPGIRPVHLLSNLSGPPL